jgi:hypothetical protein
MSLALVNGSLCFQAACRGAEGAPTNQAERTGTSGGQDLGLLAIDHARSFSSNVLAEATTSGLMVMSISKGQLPHERVFCRVAAEPGAGGGRAATGGFSSEPGRIQLGTPCPIAFASPDPRPQPPEGQHDDKGRLSRACR